MFIFQRYKSHSIVRKKKTSDISLKTDEQIINAALGNLNCNSESCVVNHPIFTKYVKENIPEISAQLNHDKEWRFKAAGPRNTTELLSNFNIDDTLQRWAITFIDFFNCPFSMIDFKQTHNTFYTISLPDVYNGLEKQTIENDVIYRKCNTFGCIINTDISTGIGKHWVAIFVDMRGNENEKWSIEFFNSSGNPPPIEIIKWMSSAEQDLIKFRSTDSIPSGDIVSTPITNVVHQKSSTECGLYTLYYILHRLNGGSYKTFTKKEIADKEMIKFRECVFRKS